MMFESNEAIEFALVKITKTPVDLRQCGKCAALVIDIQAHADWHNKLRSETTMASLGFGGSGL